MLDPQTYPLLTYQSHVDPERLAAGFARVEEIFRQYREDKHLPGLAFGIVVDGKLIYANGMGVQNVESGAPVTPDSVFRIASMTKSFTAMALVKLRDEGKVRFDDPVADYVPELASLPYPTLDSAPITVRQLLTMGAGLPQEDPWADRQLAFPEDQFGSLLAQGLSFSTPPGTRYEYSNLGYGILGRIVTNISGMRCQDYVKTQILEPLSMTSSTFDVHSVDPARLAMGYRWLDDQWVIEPPLEDGAFAPMGGLFTTINDFAHYMNLLLSAFPPRDDADNAPVRRSSLREMQTAGRIRLVGSSRATPDAVTFVQADGYGYGLATGIDSINSYSVAHGGGLPGYGTYYRLLPDVGFGIAAFSNLTYGGVGGLFNTIIAALNETGGLKPRSIVPTPALIKAQQVITDLYSQWDDEAITTLAVESLFQDDSLERRRDQVKAMRADFGACTSVTDVEPENALRGRWIMRCENGQIDVYITLTPTVPPRVMVLQFTTAKPLSLDLKQAVDQIVGMINQGNEQAGLFVDGVDFEVLRRQFAALHLQYGALEVEDTLEGDGESRARVRLSGERGNVDMTVTADAAGKVETVSFTRPREAMFVP